MLATPKVFLGNIYKRVFITELIKRHAKTGGHFDLQSLPDKST